MKKYIMLLLGLAVTFLSVAAWWSYEPLGETATTVTLEEACDAGRVDGETDGRFVTLGATLDVDRPVFFTGLADPAYTAAPQDELFLLTPEDGTNEDLLQAALGAAVRLEGVIDPTTAAVMQKIVQHPGTDKPDEIVSEKYIAPILGSDNRLLVLSDTYGAGADAAADWATQTGFEGRLSRLSDIRRNADGVSHEPYEICQTMSNYAGQIAEDAYVLLTEMPVDPVSERYFLPVAGSEDRLFVQVTEAEAGAINASGTLTGIIEPDDAGQAASLARALGTDLDGLGATGAVLTLQTAAEYNAGHRAMHTVGLMFGLFCTFLGGGAIWLTHKINRWKRAKMEAAVYTFQNEVEYRKAA